MPTEILYVCLFLFFLGINPLDQFIRIALQYIADPSCTNAQGEVRVVKVGVIFYFKLAFYKHKVLVLSEIHVKSTEKIRYRLGILQTTNLGIILKKL